MPVAIYICSRFTESLFRLIRICFVVKFPHIYRIRGCSADFYSSFLAKNVKRLFQISGVNVCRTFDGGNRAVFETDHRHSHILGLQIGVELPSCLAVHLLYLPAECPAQQVNAMNALIHQRAAVQGPCPSPGGLLIIRPVPVPAHVDRAVRQTAKPPLLQSPAHGLDGKIKSVLVAGAHLYSLFLRTADDGIRVRHAHGHGFFDDYMDSMADAV